MSVVSVVARLADDLLITGVEVELLCGREFRHLASATCLRPPLATGAMVWNTPSFRGRGPMGSSLR
jgi:hypothetical protein